MNSHEQSLLKSRRINYLFLVLLLIATGCNSGTQTIPILDFAEALKNPEDFNLSEYAEEITYVGLETRDDCLISGGTGFLTGGKVTKINNDLYIQSGSYHNGQMYKFSMTGKFLCPIGRLGFGPECPHPNFNLIQKKHSFCV